MTPKPQQVFGIFGGHNMLLAISEVSRRLGVSRSTCERLRRDHSANFPRAIHIGPNSVRFDADELAAWIESRRKGEAA